MQEQQGRTTRNSGLALATNERNVVVCVETESRLAGHAIIGKAVRHFGPEGLDLGISEQSERSVRFEDCAGFVSIALHLRDGTRRTHVKVVGREYGPQIHAFIDTL